MTLIASGIITGLTFNTTGDAITTVLDTGAAGAGNRYLKIFVYWRYRGQTTLTATYNGVAMTADGALINSGSTIGGCGFGLVAPATASNLLGLDPGTSSANSVAMVVWEVHDGVDQTTPITDYTPGTGVGSGGTTVAAVSLANGAGKTAIFSAGVRDTGDTASATTHNVTARQNGGATNIFACIGDGAGASPLAPDATYSGDFQWIGMGVNVTPAAVAAAPPADEYVVVLAGRRGRRAA